MPVLRVHSRSARAGGGHWCDRAGERSDGSQASRADRSLSRRAAELIAIPLPATDTPNQKTQKKKKPTNVRRFEG